MIEVMFPNSSGLDVHKKTVTACVLVPKAKGGYHPKPRTFRTTTAGLQELAAWLQSYGITHVVMESTGVYWKPVYNILDPAFEVWLVNARHVQQVPGRKPVLSLRSNRCQRRRVADHLDALWTAPEKFHPRGGPARFARPDPLSHPSAG